EYGLRTITIGNGYNVTVGDIHSNIVSPEGQLNCPAVNADFIREEYRNAAGQRSLGWLPKIAYVDLLWNVKNIDSLRAEESKALADCEKYFFNNRHIPDSGGSATVFGDTMFLGNERRGMEADSPAGQIITHMKITYLQAQLDPTSRVMSTTRPARPPIPPSTVSISRRESLREALIRNLRLITTGGGYKTTTQVNADIKSFEQLMNKVEVNIYPETEDVLNADDFGLTDNLAHKAIDYRIDANGTSIDKIIEEREKIVADVEYLIMNNWNLPDSSGRSTALECVLTYNESLGIGTDEPNGIMRIGLRCFYRQQILDPTKPIAT
ncbi:MAG: hypothetical protein KKF27_22035, partial [Gammaproteobacteria bacterium]|nr:hypothetical protein [Gammaproteobacteria bacterium]